MKGKFKEGFYRDPTSLFPYEVLRVFHHNQEDAWYGPNYWGIVAVKIAAANYQPTATGGILTKAQWRDLVPVEDGTKTDLSIVTTPEGRVVQIMTGCTAKPKNLEK